jgi:protein arginine kinase activator
MQEKVCPKCSHALSEFYKTGMLGCPYCYKAFATELVAVLNKVQGATVHTGKSPVIDSVEKELMFEYGRLKLAKEKAIIDKNSSKGWELEKEIKALEFELKKRGLI